MNIPNFTSFCFFENLALLSTKPSRTPLLSSDSPSELPSRMGPTSPFENVSVIVSVTTAGLAISFFILIVFYVRRKTRLLKKYYRQNEVLQAALKLLLLSTKIFRALKLMHITDNVGYSDTVIVSAKLIFPVATTNYNNIFIHFVIFWMLYDVFAHPYFE